MKLIEKILRTWYYFRVGFGTYLVYSLTILNFCTSLYYLSIQNIPALTKIIPSFTFFIFATAFTAYPLGAFVGWLHFKKIGVFKTEQQINVESNPYTNTKIAPINIPIWWIWYRQALKYGMVEQAEEIKKVIEESLK